MPELSERDRGRILDDVADTVARKFFDPRLNGVDWNGAVAETRELVMRATQADEFERLIANLLSRLKASHCGFFHESRPRVGAKNALAATMRRVSTVEGECWMFEDVHGGGPADVAGIKPGDILLAIGDRPMGSDGLPAAINLGQTTSITVRQPGGFEKRLELCVPKANKRDQPVVQVQKVTSRKLADGIGYLKVAMFPGVIGIDIANEITSALAQLDAGRLIIDLRGNTGGGLGCIRLASLLTPDRRGIGYSLTRTGASKSMAKEQLPRLDRIPNSKLGIIPLALKYAFRDQSIALGTEGLGSQPFHGTVALLTNEHTASAAEIIAAFAVENGLAAVVGTKTAGRLVGAKSFKVGAGYRVALPVVAFRTWGGRSIEGSGIEPVQRQTMTAEDLVAGRDPQLTCAIQAVG